MLFSSWKKDSLYPSSRSCDRTTMELSPHPNDIRVRLIVMYVPRKTSIPIVKDVFLTEIVIRHVKNRVFFHPLLQLIKILWFDISWCCWDSESFLVRLNIYTYMFFTICVLVFRIPFIISFARDVCTGIVSFCVVWAYVMIGISSLTIIWWSWGMTRLDVGYWVSDMSTVIS